jgi:endoglucanase
MLDAKRRTRKVGIRGTRKRAVLTIMTVVGAMVGVAAPMVANAAEGCEADYNVVSDWGSGFQANVSITAGEAINGWTIEWDFTTSVSNVSSWNVSEQSLSGLHYSATDAGWNGSIAAGQTREVFGFTASGTGGDVTNVKINGVACDGSDNPTSDEPTADGPTTPPVGDAQIVDDMGAGWNLGNSLEANANGIPSETAWNNPTVTQALIDSVQAAGFDTIRIPVSYLNYIGPGPDYTIDTSWLNRVQEVVDYAYDRGMYVVINMHGDGFKAVPGSWLICDASDQATIEAKYQKAWEQIATRFADYDEHLILESMNEEFDGQFGEPTQPCYSNINSYNQIFVDTVRQTGGNNTSRWLLVPGWNTNIDYTTGDYGFEIPSDGHRSPSIPSDEQRIMISVHYYDPWDFAGEENGNITQWGPSATDPSRTSTWGQEDFMEGQLQKTYNAFVAQGYPVVIGEYGSIDKSSHDSTNIQYREDFAHALVATAKEYGAATIYWDNGFNGQYGHGLFDRNSNQVTQPGIVDAIMSAL